MKTLAEFRSTKKASNLLQWYTDHERHMLPFSEPRDKRAKVWIYEGPDEDVPAFCVSLLSGGRLPDEFGIQVGHTFCFYPSIEEAEQAAYDYLFHGVDPVLALKK